MNSQTETTFTENAWVHTRSSVSRLLFLVNWFYVFLIVWMSEWVGNWFLWVRLGSFYSVCLTFPIWCVLVFVIFYIVIKEEYFSLLYIGVFPFKFQAQLLNEVKIHKYFFDLENKKTNKFHKVYPLHSINCWCKDESNFLA